MLKIIDAQLRLRNLINQKQLISYRKVTGSMSVLGNMSLWSWEKTFNANFLTSSLQF